MNVVAIFSIFPKASPLFPSFSPFSRAVKIFFPFPSFPRGKKEALEWSFNFTVVKRFWPVVRAHNNNDSTRAPARHASLLEDDDEGGPISSNSPDLYTCLRYEHCRRSNTLRVASRFRLEIVGGIVGWRKGGRVVLLRNRSIKSRFVLYIGMKEKKTMLSASFKARRILMKI